MSQTAANRAGVHAAPAPRSAGEGSNRAVTAEPHHVVIIGSGFGGLFAARTLNRHAVTVTLIDRTPHHLFQPLLYQVATGVLSEGEITPATREILRRQANARVIVGEVTEIDLAARVVTAHTGDITTAAAYDSLIVAAGSTHSYFGRPDFAEHAPGMKSVDDAIVLRGRIYGAFEAAEVITDETARQPWLTFVVVGAGPTGVEMAGQLIELSRRSLRGNFRSFDPAHARVVLLEAGPRVLPTFGDRLSRRTLADLQRLGVDVRLNTPVIGVDESGVDIRPVVDGDTRVERIEARTKIWAAGVHASPLSNLLAEATGAEVNRAGQVQVLPDCSLRGHPEVYVVGDMMQMPVPAVAQVAIQSGKFVARQIIARVEGRPPQRRFYYRDKGSLATIARFRAVAKVGPASVTGTAAWFLWLIVHLTYLVCFKNRFLVLVHWGISFVGRGRAERTAPLSRATFLDGHSSGPPPRRGGGDGSNPSSSETTELKDRLSHPTVLEG